MGLKLSYKLAPPYKRFLFSKTLFRVYRKPNVAGKHYWGQNGVNTIEFFICLTNIFTRDCGKNNVCTKCEKVVENCHFKREHIHINIINILVLGARIGAHFMV